MDFRKVLNDVVPVKYAVPIAWGGLLAGVWIGYTEGRKVGKTNEEPKGSEEAKELLEEMKTLMIQMDFKFEEQQERFNHSIRQMAVAITNLKHPDEQRTFDDYVAELNLEAPPPKVDKRVDVTVVGSEWNHETEVSQRDPEAPYVIHRNEYFNDDMG
jgi:Threonine synthase